METTNGQVPYPILCDKLGNPPHGDAACKQQKQSKKRSHN